MRPNSVDVERPHPASAPQHGLGETLVATALLAATILAGLAVATWPGVTAVVVAALLVGYAAGRVVLRRRRGGRRPRLCIPRTDVCVGA